MRDEIYHRLTEEDKWEIEATWGKDTSQGGGKVYAQLKGYAKYSLRQVERVLREARRRAIPIPEDPFIEPWGKGWPSDPEGTAVALCLMRVSGVLHDFAWFRPTDRELRWAIRLHRLFDIFDSERGLVSAYCLWIMSRRYARRERASLVFADWPRAGLYGDLDKILHSRFWQSEDEIPDSLHELDSKLIEWEFEGFRRFKEWSGNETR